MKTNAIFYLACLTAVLLGAPAVQACGGGEVWLTQEEVAALKKGAKIWALERNVFYHLDLELAPASDPWAWLHQPATPPTAELEVPAARAALLASLEAPFAFQLLQLHPSGGEAAIPDAATRQAMELKLQRGVIACDGSALIDSAHL